jgi:hypothetical protein
MADPHHYKKKWPEIRALYKHARQLAESTQRTQAAYDQGLQEAMQQEFEALEVQEVSIAARKMELQAKMSKLRIGS